MEVKKKKMTNVSDTCQKRKKTCNWLTTTTTSDGARWWTVQGAVVEGEEV